MFVEEKENKLIIINGNMQNKLYYTPDIDSFHVGFEYEWSEEGRKIWIDEIANQDDVLLAYSCYEETPEIYSNEYRVKYLDALDIESLDWEAYNIGTGVYKKYINEQLVHLINYRENFSDTSLVKIMLPDTKETLFYGEIKNKSELKQILKMINIK